MCNIDEVNVRQTRKVIGHNLNIGYNLRSTGKLLLDHPKGKMLTTLGARSFSAAAPKLWNELPVELRQATSLDSFKSQLKTYFLRSIFYSL